MLELSGIPSSQVPARNSRRAFTISPVQISFNTPSRATPTGMAPLTASAMALAPTAPATGDTPNAIPNTAPVIALNSTAIIMVKNTFAFIVFPFYWFVLKFTLHTVLFLVESLVLFGLLLTEGEYLT